MFEFGTLNETQLNVKPFTNKSQMEKKAAALSEYKSKCYVCLKSSDSYEMLSLTVSNPLQLWHCFHGNTHMYKQCSSTKSSTGLFDTAFGQWKFDLNATGLKERVVSVHKLKVALTELEATQVPGLPVR